MGTSPALSPSSPLFSPDGSSSTQKRKNSNEHNSEEYIMTTSTVGVPKTTTITASGARRYRASRACQYCRTRKVRCDVLRTNADCTNCRLDNRECILLESRRGKPEQWRNYGQETIRRGPAKPQSQPTDATRRDSIAIVDDDQPGISNEITAAVADTSTGDVPVCVTFDGNDVDDEGEHDEETDEGEGDTAKKGDDGEHGETDNGSASAYTPSESLDALAFVFRDTSTAVASGSVSAPGSHTAATPINNNSPGIPQYSPPQPLPSFIAPFRNKIPAEDRAFLARKGALTVPEPELRVAILRGYIFSVHPFMPMLDIKPFVQAVLSTDADPPASDRRISLLLFQAVMFAGLSSLEPQYLHRLGFATAKQAREVFFVRVKLLYELDVEPDSAAVFQSLLLMSSWYSKWNSWKDTSHWTAQALLVAQNMGLHREPTAACGSPTTQRRRRRMWWSLYIRDRMLALGTRRPMRIKEGDYDVGMLSMEDFEEEEGEDNDYQGLLLSASDREGTARMCVELAKLCVLIAQVLSTQYTTLSTQPAVSHTTMVVPRRSKQRDDRDNDDLQQCDAAIQQWQKNLSTNLHITEGALPASSPCIDFHWAMLNLAHLSLVNVLHRTQALPPPQGTSPSDDSPADQAMRRASRLKVKDAACKVTKIAQAMLQRGQVRFLGLNGITALLAACLSHMVDIRGASSTGGSDDNEDVRDASIFRFSQNMQVLYAMTSMYATADAAVSFLASVVKKVQLPIPAAATPTTPTAPVTISAGIAPPPLPPTKRPTTQYRSMSMSSVNTQAGHAIAGTSGFTTANSWTPSHHVSGFGNMDTAWNSMAAGKQFNGVIQGEAQPRLQTASTHLSPPQPHSLGMGLPKPHGVTAPVNVAYDTTMKDAGPLPTMAARSNSHGFSSYDDILLDSLFPAPSLVDHDLNMDPSTYSYDFFLDNFDLPDCQPQGME
ncbi:hypothetical protein SEUCBS139899_010871 [Sporothrix eucalyptigena]